MPILSAAPPSAEFSDVAARAPAEAVAYLKGKLAAYPAGAPAAIVDFSPSDILETMDTVVLDTVRRQHGADAVRKLHEEIADAMLSTVRNEYGERPVVVALDAGHGGKRGVNWDPGSEGTEAEHTRAVATAVQRLSQTERYRGITVRPIYSDAFDDDLGLPSRLNKPTMNHLVVRQARASMLAAEAGAWNAAHPDAAVAMHELSIHFNAGAGGAMVLHQGNTVRPEFAARSVSFARRYLSRATAGLNGLGLLPVPLTLWGSTGLHDDVMMYRPDYLSDEDIRGITLRYAGLQGGGYLTRYLDEAVANTR